MNVFMKLCHSYENLQIFHLTITIFRLFSVVDVYSKWCGPCQGMAANLKKLKLEIGGDMLHLAAVRYDMNSEDIIQLLFVG